MEISERLREARKKTGMTQDQVAEVVMISRVTISHWENGRSLPDIASLISLSDLYEISLDELVKGDLKMTDKVKKDVRNAQTNKRLILTSSILVVIVGIIYVTSVFVGGGFREFCDAAIVWVLFGIGLAATLTYLSQREHKNGLK